MCRIQHVDLGFVKCTLFVHTTWTFCRATVENPKRKMTKPIETRGFQMLRYLEFPEQPLHVVRFALHSNTFHMDVEQWLSD